MRCQAAVILPFLCLLAMPVIAAAQNSSADEAALDKTDATLRAAFASGDLDMIRRLHSPDVVKSLSPDGLVNGRDAVVDAIAANLKPAHLEFVESKVESSVVMGDSAVRIFHFSIRATPRDGSAATTFSGRAMVVYIRTRESPTGWATIRELVQASE